MSKAITGLYKRGGIWHIDKLYRGQRLLESTGTSERKEAEEFLVFRLEQIRQEKIFGVQIQKTWRDAAARFLTEYQDQPSILLSATYLEQLDPFIGGLPLSHVDDESLAAFIQFKKSEQGGAVSNRTINIALERVIRILNLCHRKWRDDEKRPWLHVVPMITKLDENATRRKPYPLSWEEQDLLLAELPEHLKRMMLYKVNTGCREQEVCKLQWDWEVAVPELNTSVFLIPNNFGGRNGSSGVKNGDDRLVILNSVAKSIIDKQRSLHPVYVFPYGLSGKEPSCLHRMNDSAWKKARIRAADAWEKKHNKKASEGFRSIRIHDLKHTFGRRLRAADIPLEDRQILLGHKNGSITSHYSATQLDKLIASANSIIGQGDKAPILTILRRNK